MNKFSEILKNSERIVFFGGAGVSTASGIPDYRSKDGIYNQKYKYPPEVMLSRGFFDGHTEEFFEFYKDKMLHPTAKPNAAHRALAKLEQAGKLSCVITQNVDGLHQAAGSKKVLELHGSAHRNFCTECAKEFDMLYMKNSAGIPRCQCGGVIKPYVVLYEEGLSIDVIDGAIREISNADTLIIGGTSLAVYPAAGLVDYFKGKNLVVINQTPTSSDSKATLCINDDIAKVFEEAEQELGL